MNAPPREYRLLLQLPPGPRLLYTKPAARQMLPELRARYRTEQLRRWLRNSGNSALAQRPIAFPTNRPVELRIEICPPHENRFDFGDRTEAVLLLLDELGIASPSQVANTETVWVASGAPCVVTVRERIFA